MPTKLKDYLPFSSPVRTPSTQGCALKRGRFESFCAISLVRALPPDVIIQTRYTMALLVVYWLHTRGFSFDRPLGLEYKP